MNDLQIAAAEVATRMLGSSNNRPSRLFSDLREMAMQTLSKARSRETRLRLKSKMLPYPYTMRLPKIDGSPERGFA